MGSLINTSAAIAKKMEEIVCYVVNVLSHTMVKAINCYL